MALPTFEREAAMDWKSTRDGPDDWHLTDNLHAEHGKGDPFAAAIRATRMSMLITDPRQADNPIVFANDAFLRLTGYRRDEVIGSNCRFLQGERTDPAAVDELRCAIAERRDINIDILNYRKDGTSFWNALYISPVINEAGDLQFYFASQLDVTDRKDSEQRIHADKKRFEAAVKERTAQLEERTAQLEAALETQKALVHEVDHRVKNNLQMISSLIILQSRSIPDPKIRASLRSMLERVEALSTVHRRLYQSQDVTRFDVGAFVKDLVTDLVAASGRDDIEVDLDVGPMDIQAIKAAPAALIINELVTNALKHAFNGGGANHLLVRLRQEGDSARLDIRDNGSGMGDGANGNGSFGMRLIETLSRQLQARVEWLSATSGTHVAIEMPIEPDRQ